MAWTRPLLLVACATVMLTACGRGDASPGEGVEEALGGCPQVQVVGVRGQSQSLDHHRGLGTEVDGVVTRLESLLAARGVDDVDVDALEHRSRDASDLAIYDADVAQGKKLLAEELADDVEACPDTPIVVAAFSQGAQIAQETLAAHARLAEHVTVLALLGSPRHDPDAPVDHLDLPGTASSRPGALGAGPSLGSLEDRTVDGCLEGDVVCDSPGFGQGDLTIHKHGYEKSVVRDAVAEAIADRLP